MSRSFFLVPPSSFVVCPFWTKVVFFFPPLRFLWPFVVVVVFWPLPRFSPFVVAVLLSCPVRTTTKEMDHNFVSLSVCCQRNGWQRKPDRKKGEKLPTGTQAVRMRAGAFVWRASILSLPFLYLLLFSS
jgi:hypothetical protein